MTSMFRTEKGYNLWEKILIESRERIKEKRDMTRDPWLVQISCSELARELYQLQQQYNGKLVEVYKVIRVQHWCHNRG